VRGNKEVCGRHPVRMANVDEVVGPPPTTAASYAGEADTISKEGHRQAAFFSLSGWEMWRRPLGTYPRIPSLHESRNPASNPVRLEIVSAGIPLLARYKKTRRPFYPFTDEMGNSLLQSIEEHEGCHALAGIWLPPSVRKWLRSDST
jgi:hypothetical protein